MASRRMGRLHPPETIRGSSDFRQVYDGGRKRIAPFVIVHALSRGDSNPPRLGFTVSRRCGKACVRNRIRRRMREIVRVHCPNLAPGWDIVLTARPPAADAAFATLRAQVISSLGDLKVLCADV